MDTHGAGSPSITSINGSTRPDPRPRPKGVYIRVVKPALDRVLGLILLLVSLPVVLIAGVAVLISLGRPIFYSQQRIGLDGKPFRLHKLRTMIPDRRVVPPHQYQGGERRRAHKSPDDPRVTRLGRVLRALRLDELPQFWNVVKGDMSLVGPRPELPEIVERYQPWQHQRHMVKPGVTGPWQVSQRNGKPMHECTQIDLEYLDRIGLLHDLRILARTPMAMLGDRRGF